MTMLLRLEWQDGKLTFVEPGSADTLTEIQPVGTPDNFTAAAGNLISGETVQFRRVANGRVGSVFFGSATLLRLDPQLEDDLVAD